MEFTFLQGCLIFLAAMMAGALNSVAGGGSFISFPALHLIAGVPEKFANITNTVALWPGSVASVGAYRKELMTQRKGLVLLSAVSLVGGGLGAVLLLGTPQATFTMMVPFLMLFATLLFTFGRRMSNALRARTSHMAFPPGVTAGGVVLLQFITSIYGGFFGGGIGIMMLAILSLWGMDNIHDMNALKTALASLINGVAVLIFVAGGTVYWPQGIVMIVGAILGGFFGAYYARQIDPEKVRTFVIIVASLLTVYFFIRTFILK